MTKLHTRSDRFPDGYVLGSENDPIYEYYTHLVVEDGIYIDVNDDYEPEFMAWVRTKLRERYENAPDRIEPVDP